MRTGLGVGGGGDEGGGCEAEGRAVEGDREEVRLVERAAKRDAQSIIGCRAWRQPKVHCKKWQLARSGNGPKDGVLTALNRAGWEPWPFRACWDYVPRCERCCCR